MWTLKQALNCNNTESFVAGLLVVSRKFGKAPFHLHGSLFATKCDFPFGTLLPGPSLRTMGLNGRWGEARHHRGVALTFAPASRSSYEAREVRDPVGLGGPTNEKLTGLHFKLQAVEAPLLQHNVDRKRVEQASMNLPSTCGTHNGRRRFESGPSTWKSGPAQVSKPAGSPFRVKVEIDRPRQHGQRPWHRAK